MHSTIITGDGNKINFKNKKKKRKMNENKKEEKKEI